MSKKIKLLLFATFFSISIEAIEMTHTDEILNNAIDATQSMQKEMNQAIDDTSFIQTEEIISEPIIETIVVETIVPSAIVNEEVNSSTIIPVLPTPSNELNITTTTENNNTQIEAEKKEMVIPPVLIKETNISIEENTIEIEENTIEIEEKNETKPQPIITNKGNATAGKNIFKYVLKTDCGINGHKFASKYTQEEWEEIAELHKFKETIFETCPNARLYYQDKWTVDLYKFFHEMSDEDGIPEC